MNRSSDSLLLIVYEQLEPGLTLLREGNPLPLLHEPLPRRAFYLAYLSFIESEVFHRTVMNSFENWVMAAKPTGRPEIVLA